MAREFYSPKTKAAILKAVRDARAAKKSWAEAHVAAKAAGYKGGLPAIIKLTRFAGGKSSPKKRGPGKRAGRPGRPAGKPMDLGSIDAAVERIVQQRVREAIDRAIEVLKSF